MKLASLKNNTRDGELIVVSKDLTRAVSAKHICANLQSALDSWDELSPALENLSTALNADNQKGFKLDFKNLHSPLPRAYEWIDGSAYLNHVRLVRKARGAEMPASFLTDPLVYQGGSGIFLSPYDPIPLADESWGCDFESEVSVVLGDTPMGVSPQNASQYVRLIMLVNDVSLRNLIPAELAKGFGFFQSKPATAFSPIAVTPDELGTAWDGGKVHLPLVTHLNGKRFGSPLAGEGMAFSFFELIAHLTKTRAYTAGTILGSGTVSNEDRSRGSSCLAEVRTIETIEQGQPQTPFLKAGDEVEIEMFASSGQSIFGKIHQKVKKC